MFITSTDRVSDTHLSILRGSELTLQNEFCSVLLMVVLQVFILRGSHLLLNQENLYPLLRVAHTLQICFKVSLCKIVQMHACLHFLLLCFSCLTMCNLLLSLLLLFFVVVFFFSRFNSRLICFQFCGFKVNFRFALYSSSALVFSCFFPARFLILSPVAGAGDKLVTYLVLIFTVSSQSS